MRKTDKKIENQLRLALTTVCEVALKEITGFKWLTHIVDYAHFPQSLKIICIFDDNENLDTYLQSTYRSTLHFLIDSELKKLKFTLKKIDHIISYDTESDCQKQHNGNWAKRLG